MTTAPPAPRHGGPGEPGDRPARSGRADVLALLLRHYAWTLPLIVAAAATGFWSTVRAQYTADWERTAIDVASDLNVDLLADLESTGPEPGTPADWRSAGVPGRVDALARPFLRTRDVLRINIFAPDGTIVYSTEPRVRGRVSRQNTKLAQALAGEAVSDVEKSAKPADFADTRWSEDVLETYVPMRRLGGSGAPTGEVVGAFEVYQGVGPMAAGLRHFGWVLAGGSAGILGVLGAVLAGVGGRAAAAVERERAAEEELKRGLERAVLHLEETVAARTEEVLRGRERLERAARLALAGELASAVAHEVRNSASTTRLFLQLLAARPGEPADPDALDATLEAVSRMEALSGDLLRLARPAPLRRTRVDLGRLAREQVTLIRPLARERGVQVVGPEPTVGVEGWWDRELVAEAILNLLLNAVQAFEAAVPGARREVRVALCRDEGPPPRVELEVRDTGPGVAEPIRGRLFEPFATTRDEGTGLGLPIVRRIAEGHGGSVVVEQVDGGVSARLRLPFGEEAGP